ncbi:MAG: EsaB/YukD family protein [Micrococcales bacterium]|nr:EsaB/YukD family protein [Micrococcales bacterium]
MPDQHINISIELNSRQLDLRVPNDVTLARLTELISQVLEEHHISMPQQWHLEVQDKPIGLSGYDTLSDFPIGNGDIFTVTIEPQEGPASI